MKRTYIKPDVNVVEIHIQGIVAISTVSVSNETYDEGTMTDLVKQETNGGNSIWDNEW
jgi:hypothetical protein